MDGFLLTYDGFEPGSEGLREALTSTGNGYLCTRGAAEWEEADGVHYPGTYVHGGYNRETTTGPATSPLATTTIPRRRPRSSSPSTANASSCPGDFATIEADGSVTLLGRGPSASTRVGRRSSPKRWRLWCDPTPTSWTPSSSVPPMSGSASVWPPSWSPVPAGAPFTRGGPGTLPGPHRRLQGASPAPRRRQEAPRRRWLSPDHHPLSWGSASRLVPRAQAGQMLVHNDDPGTRVGQDEAHLVGHEPEVDRHHDGPEAPPGEDGLDHLDAVARRPRRAGRPVSAPSEPGTRPAG